MNILILSDFFNRFYTSLVAYLHQRGIPSTLHVAYLNGYTPSFFAEPDGRIELPEKEGYAGAANRKALVDYVAAHHIQAVLFPQVSDVSCLIGAIKACNPAVACLFLLHSRPDLVMADKAMQLKEMNANDIHSCKDRIAWLFPSLYLYALKFNWRRWAVRQYRSFDKVIVLSPSYIPEYEKVMGKKDTARKLVAIPNPRIEYQSLVPVEQKKKQIIYVGALTKLKAVHRLLAIWKKIEKEIPDWRFLVVGEGPMREQNEKLAVELGLKNVTFLGARPSIPYIDESAILCLASNIEGLPTVFTEAMTLGVVPIGFDSFSGIYDMIDNGKNGVIVPAFDTNEYARALSELARNGVRRCRMAHAATDKVNQYRIDKVGEKWIELFKTLNLLPAE